MDFDWELSNSEKSQDGHLLGEVVLKIDGEKKIDSVLNLNMSRKEWERLGKYILQKKEFREEYPFICSCGEGECTGIMVSFQKGKLKIEANISSFELEGQDITDFLKSLNSFFLDFLE